jgi:small-conductance mechanosensitive channel
LILQETPPPPPPSLGDAILEKVVYYLNYPFVNQKEFKVSLLSLVLLVAVIVIASIVSRYLRRVLARRVLTRFHLDAGISYTLLRVIHYLIIVGGLLYGLKLGFAIDLTSIAVILGFLSVGIGFGLQYIASDIVSGFILLFERPVRVGDRLKIDSVEGRVESVSLRSTRVVTNDDVTVIVPNSELVRHKIINWSYCKQVRIRIPIGVAYGSDLEKATKALVEAAQAVKLVLDEPPPKVQLVKFNDWSIDLELLVWIDMPHNHTQIRSDVNFQIERLFRQYDIEIPFPQRDLRLRSGSLDLDQHGLEVVSQMDADMH